MLWKPRPRPPGTSRAGPSRLRRNLRNCTWDGILAVPTIFLATPGNLVITVLLMRYYHLSTTQFGIIVALLAACSVAQLILMPRLNQRFTAKQLNLFAAWVHWGAFLALAALIGFLPPGEKAIVFPVLFGLFLVLAATQALMTVTWASWVHEFTPERIRGRYFGRRNAIMQAGTVAFLVLLGCYLEQVSGSDASTLRTGLMAVLGGSMVIRTGSIVLQHRTHSPADLHVAVTKSRRSSALPWWEQLREISRQRNLLRFLGFGAAFGFASNLMGPFFNVFMLDVLRMSTGQVTALAVLACASGALSTAAWGRAIDRFGNRPIMILSLVVWMVNGYLWTATTPERLWLLAIAWLVAGVYAAGFLLAGFGLLLKIVPRQAKTVAISINAAVTSLPAAVAPIIGGALLKAAVEQGWNELAVYQWGSAIAHTLVLLTVLILQRVEEPRSQSFGELVGVMRSYRQIASIMGLSHITNYLFTRRKR